MKDWINVITFYVKILASCLTTKTSTSAAQFTSNSKLYCVSKTGHMNGTMKMFMFSLTLKWDYDKYRWLNCKNRK